MRQKERKNEREREKGTKYFADRLYRSEAQHYSALPSVAATATAALLLHSPRRCFFPLIFSRLLIGRPVNCAFHKAPVQRFTESFSAAKEHRCARAAQRDVNARALHARVSMIAPPVVGRTPDTRVYTRACLYMRTRIRIHAHAYAHHVQRVHVKQASTHTPTRTRSHRRTTHRVYTASS